MREDEHLHAGRARQLRGADGRRMQRLVGALALLGGKGRFVHEDVGVLGRIEYRGRGPGVSRQDDSPAGARGSEDLPRLHGLAARNLDRVAVLQPSEERTRGHAERARRLDVEAARPRGLRERVTVRRHAVLDGESEDPVVAAVEDVPRPELHELDFVGELAEDALEHGEEVDQAGWAVDTQGQIPSAQCEGLQHARQAEVVVRVVVREEHLGQLDEPYGRAEELPLGSLAAIEEDPFASAPNQRAGEPTARRRNGAGCAEKHDVQVHGPSVGGAGLESGPAASSRREEDDRAR